MTKLSAQPLPSTDYNLSFTAASLRPELARIIAECHLETCDWSLTRERILSTNALQARSNSSAVRMEMELRHRLSTLTADQLTLLAQAPTEDRTAIAWLAACKRIPFIYEFAAEDLRDKLEAMDPVLRRSDYESYVDAKSLIHPGLARLKESSQVRIRQALTRMLKEAGILEPGSGLGTVQRPALSPDVIRVITSDSPHWLAGFLVPDAEIPSF